MAGGSLAPLAAPHREAGGTSTSNVCGARMLSPHDQAPTETHALLARFLARGGSHEAVLLALCQVTDQMFQTMADAGIDIDHRLCAALATVERGPRATHQEICEAARPVSRLAMGLTRSSTATARTIRCAVQGTMMLTNLALRRDTGMFMAAMATPAHWAIQAIALLHGDRELAERRVLGLLQHALEADYTGRA